MQNDALTNEPGHENVSFFQEKKLFYLPGHENVSDDGEPNYFSRSDMRMWVTDRETNK